MQTPIELLIKAFNEAIAGMSPEPSNHTRQTTIMCRDLAEAFLYKEENAIKNAFMDGEQNVWNGLRDENKFEYEGREDYFNKNYKN